METAKTFVKEEEIMPESIEMTPRLMKYLEELEIRNTPFEECEDFDVMINGVVSEYGITL